MSNTEGARSMKHRTPHALERLSTRMAAVRNTLTRRAREKHEQHEQPEQPLGVRPHSKFPMLLLVGLMAIGVIALISILRFVVEALGGGAT
jgi:hypothetical protein